MATKCKIVIPDLHTVPEAGLLDVQRMINNELERRKQHCPSCNSHCVVACKGSTNLKLINGFNWICRDCLYEW